MLLEFLVKHNDDIDYVALKNASENLKLTGPSIHKDIVNAIVKAFGVGIIFLATRLFVLNANIRIVYSIYIILDFLAQIPSRFGVLKILASCSQR